ncbi:tripartite tricarboxylate transporter substrate-binding protein [Verticiella alkaliphila]|uniref:tripartite tricarboxylate transporter substrate-binding protein n=1 Tax=Verticiella alkaliphila TaxID=2779529 RepID=UPI0035302102
MCDQTTTAQRSGATDIDFRSWNGLFAPARTPPAVVRQLNDAIRRALSDPELLQQIRAVGVTSPSAQTNTPEALATRVSSEIARLRLILESKHVKVD